jgi:hypothetical protein
MRISKEAKELIGIDVLKILQRKARTKKKKKKRKVASKNLNSVRKHLSEKGIKTTKTARKID